MISAQTAAFRAPGGETALPGGRRWQAVPMPLEAMLLLVVGLFAAAGLLFLLIAGD